MNRTYKLRYHFNALHNIVPENEEGKHAHSFLVILHLEVVTFDLEEQNNCEKALKEYLEHYNGKYLNEMEKFRGKIPTLEVICETLYSDTAQIAAEYGMEQVQMEVGDSPIALFSIGKNRLPSGTYQAISDVQFERYQRQLSLQYGKVTV